MYVHLSLKSIIFIPSIFNALNGSRNTFFWFFGSKSGIRIEIWDSDQESFKNLSFEVSFKTIYKYCNRKLKVCIRFVSSNSRVPRSSKVLESFSRIRKIWNLLRFTEYGWPWNRYRPVSFKIETVFYLENESSIVQFNGKSFHFNKNLTIFDQKYQKCFIPDLRINPWFVNMRLWAGIRRVLICL